MDTIKLLKKLVSINSIFPNEKDLADYLYQYLNDIDFKVDKHYISENDNSRFNVLAEKGNGNISYLLYAHTDTVNIYGNWENDPFKLRVSDDIAIGLGSADMKSGIVAILNAIKNFEPKNYKLKIAFGVDEENYSEGAYKLSLTNWLDDIKGVLVPESSLPANKHSNPGKVISIGRKGRAVYKIKIYGKSAHGVEKDKGINAINQASKLILELDNFKINESEMGNHSFFVRSFNCENNSLSIPDYAEFYFDCHLVNSDTSDSLLEKLKNYIDTFYKNNILSRGYKEFSIEKIERPTPFLEPFLVDKDSYFLKISSNAVKEIYGDYEYNIGQSVADENIFGALNIPTLTIGPVADNHHSAEEWVSIKSIDKLSQIYTNILKKLDQYHENNIL